MHRGEYGEEKIDYPALHAKHFVTAPRAGGRTEVVRVDVCHDVFGWQIDLRAIAH